MEPLHEIEGHNEEVSLHSAPQQREGFSVATLLWHENKSQSATLRWGHQYLGGRNPPEIEVTLQQPILQVATTTVTNQTKTSLR